MTRKKLFEDKKYSKQFTETAKNFNGNTLEDKLAQAPYIPDA